MATAYGVSGLFLLLSLFLNCNGQNTNYIIGAGIADITGPAAEVDMVSSCVFYFQKIFSVTCNIIHAEVSK